MHKCPCYWNDDGQLAFDLTATQINRDIEAMGTAAAVGDSSGMRNFIKNFWQAQSLRRYILRSS